MKLDPTSLITSSASTTHANDVLWSAQIRRKHSFLNRPSNRGKTQIENFDHQYNAAVAASDVMILPEGTELKVRLVQPLNSGKNKTGQSFQAILDENIVIKSRTVLTRGTRFTGTLVEVKGSGRVKGRAKMSMVLASMQVDSEQIPIETNMLTFEAQGTKGRDARRIGGATGIATGIGAIAGGVEVARPRERR